MVLLSGVLRRAARAAGRGVRQAHSKGALVVLGVLVVVALAVLVRRMAARRENATGSAEACAAKGKYWDPSRGKCMTPENCTKIGGEVRGGLCSRIEIQDAGAATGAEDYLEGQKCLTRDKYFDPAKKVNGKTGCMERSNCKGVVDEETGLCVESASTVPRSKTALGTLMQGATEGVTDPRAGPGSKWCKYARRGADVYGRMSCWKTYPLAVPAGDWSMCAQNEDCRDRLVAGIKAGGGNDYDDNDAAPTKSYSAGEDGTEMRGGAASVAYPGISGCKYAAQGTDVNGKKKCWRGYPLNTNDRGKYQCATSSQCRDKLNAKIGGGGGGGGAYKKDAVVVVHSGENYSGDNIGNFPPTSFGRIPLRYPDGDNASATARSITVPAGLCAKLYGTDKAYLGINGPANIPYLHNISRIGSGEINQVKQANPHWGGFGNAIVVEKGRCGKSNATTFNGYD